jgi:hypothetical protein
VLRKIEDVRDLFRLAGNDLHPMAIRVAEALTDVLIDQKAEVKHDYQEEVEEDMRGFSPTTVST